jgi:hypothetical protein
VKQPESDERQRKEAVNREQPQLPQLKASETKPGHSVKDSVWAPFGVQTHKFKK